MILVAPLWPQKEQHPNLLDHLVEEPIEYPRLWNLLVQLYVQKQLFCKRGILDKVAKCVAANFRQFTACLY